MNPQSETIIRLCVFLGVLLLMGIVERIAPRKKPTCSKPFRWANNLGLTVLNTVFVRLVIPIGAVAVAEIALRNQWGMLHQVSFPLWVKILIAVVLLDFLIYVQHVLFHLFPVLWRLHRVHHADHDFDVSTGLRFHPIEMLLSMLLKMGAVIVLGASPMAVIIFEILLNATAMFNHGNIALPAQLDKILRFFVVTPDMHRVHHSVDRRETDSNYGFNLPWWDYLCRTYQAQPRLGHDGIEIGLPEFPDSDVQRLDVMLSLPLRNISKNRTGEPGP